MVSERPYGSRCRFFHWHLVNSSCSVTGWHSKSWLLSVATKQDRRPTQTGLTLLFLNICGHFGTAKVHLIFGLTGVGIGSLAFIAGLYAFVSSHTRLQESAYGILTTTFFFCLSTTFLIIALILTIIGAKPTGLLFAIGGLVIFVLGWLILFITFFQLYGRVSHMRDRRFLRYVPIFSLINNLRMKEFSSLDVVIRSSFNLGPYRFSKAELETIIQGYSFLFIGPRYLTFQLMAIDVLVDGLKNGETANYVCCDRPPYQIWKWFKPRDPIGKCPIK
jgi:hypothetical protein